MWSSALKHTQTKHQLLENCSLHQQRTMQEHETTKSRLVVRHYQSWQDSRPNPAGPSNFSSVTYGMKRADREERDNDQDFVAEEPRNNKILLSHQTFSLLISIFD